MILCFPLKENKKAELALLLPLFCLVAPGRARFMPERCDVSVFPVLMFWLFLLIMCFDDLSTISTLQAGFIHPDATGFRNL